MLQKQVQILQKKCAIFFFKKVKCLWGPNTLPYVTTLYESIISDETKNNTQ